MKADLTRDTFNARKHFSRVLMQQGRVQLDADWNEQTSILLHYLRTVVADVVGPHAAPVHGGGFELVPSPGVDGDFGITPGRIYVDGLLVENDRADATYLNQRDLPNPDPLRRGSTYFTYLDVWERHVSALEDPTVRETALGGPDTATRARVVWQVKALSIPPPGPLSAADRDKLNLALESLHANERQLATALKTTQDAIKRAQLRQQLAAVQAEIEQTQARLNSGTAGAWCRAIEQFPRSSHAWMEARVEPTQPSTDPCIQAPAARFRGATNQLYRVEIQRGGTGLATDQTADPSTATFKWSRDNGSVASRLLKVQDDALVLENMRGFAPDGWVELDNDVLDLRDAPGVLIRILNRVGDALTFDPASNATGVDLSRMTLVRRWDQSAVGDLVLLDGAVPLTEGIWLTLEDGVQVLFTPGGTYRSGDYWLIPARVAAGGIEWPTTLSAGGSELPEALPPHGIMHHFAPLGIVSLDGLGVHFGDSCRCEFLPVNDCAQYGYDDDMGIGLELLDI